MLFTSLEKFSSSTALILTDGKVVTYQDLISEGAVLAKEIAGRNLILSVASNTSEFIAGYVGFMRAGMVQLVVNETIAPEFLDQLISVYSPRYAFLPQSLAARFSDERKTSLRNYQLLSLNNSQSVELHKDLALLLSTSGTTGSPKLVRLSHQNLQANTESIIQYLGIQPSERTITTMPLSYSYGLSILNTHLTAGASVVVTEASIMSREFWNQFKNQYVTNFGGVPYFFEMLKKLRFERMDLPSLRTITQAGGKLDLALAKEYCEICLKKNMRFFIMYGQTEATARISYLSATDHPDKTSTIGKAIPGGELWLRSEQGEKIITPGEMGELIYQGKNVSMGFAEKLGDLALGDVNSQMLSTGDLANRDPDGFFTIVGRKNRFLKVFGLRLNLLELEQILLTKGYEAACTGTDEKLVIFLTKLDNEPQLEALIFELTGIHKNGFRFVKINEIPRTNSGKIDYKVLQERTELKS
jgi:acyl-coenzyme A synthetase/AMP-(fatty) acid ligase